MAALKESSAAFSKTIILAIYFEEFVVLETNRLEPRSGPVYIWPASHEKGPLDISHSVDQDQPLYDVENAYTL